MNIQKLIKEYEDELKTIVIKIDTNHLLPFPFRTDRLESEADSLNETIKRLKTLQTEMREFVKKNESCSGDGFCEINTQDLTEAFGLEEDE